LRPPVFRSRKRMGLRHFGQMGGGCFFGHGTSRWIRRPDSLSPINAEDGAAI
jgi:hypothetical protein